MVKKFFWTCLPLMAIVLFSFAQKPVQAQTIGVAPVGGGLDEDATDTRGRTINEDRSIVRPVDRVIVHKLDRIGARQWFCWPLWRPYWPILYHPIIRGRLRPVQILPPPAVINWCWWPRRCIQLHPFTWVRGVIQINQLPPPLQPGPDILNPDIFDQENQADCVGVLTLRTIKGQIASRFYVGYRLIYRRVWVVCRPIWWNVYWPICWQWWDVRTDLPPSLIYNPLKFVSWYWCWRPIRCYWIIPIRPGIDVIQHDTSDMQTPDLRNNEGALVDTENDNVDIGHISHRSQGEFKGVVNVLPPDPVQPEIGMAMEFQVDSFFDVFFDVKMDQQ